MKRNWERVNDCKGNLNHPLFNLTAAEKIVLLIFFRNNLVHFAIELKISQ